MKNDDIIDASNKDSMEILEVYKEIVNDSNVVSKIYDLTLDEEIADKVYELYKKKNKS